MVNRHIERLVRNLQMRLQVWTACLIQLSRVVGHLRYLVGYRVLVFEELVES